MSTARWIGRSGARHTAGVRDAVVAAVVLAVVTVYALTAASPATRDIIVAFDVSVVFVMGLQVFSGNSGILSFGHMSFVAIGAYVASFLTLDPSLKLSLAPGLPEPLASATLGLWPATALSVVVAVAVAAVVGMVVLRLEGASAVIAIFALTLIVHVVLLGWTKVTNGAGGLYAMPKATTVTAGFIVAVVAVILAGLYHDSRHGLQLRASREDAVAARSGGVRVRRVRLGAWALSAAISAAGGAMYAHLYTVATPDAFYLAPTFLVVVMLIVGGQASVGGAFAGAVVVTIVREVLKPVENSGVSLGPVQLDRVTGLTQMALVALILIAMYVRPEGILGGPGGQRWTMRPRPFGRESELAGVDVAEGTTAPRGE
ncbi:MAG: branched-chain amino acid transport system ATP-binding protein livM [Solirubrobacteraceae bacterium]|jgi:branched-chain amino acid transport system permease protein|nr:branched-chain amino acid transport system ATP-binding protein livM [Solirubrobacteraceae bacterium]